jgi:hypothetical protein
MTIKKLDQYGTLGEPSASPEENSQCGSANGEDEA